MIAWTMTISKLESSYYCLMTQDSFKGRKYINLLFKLYLLFFIKYLKL
jgi:hypothetical protein